MLVTRQRLHVILFPFNSSDTNLVNVVCLKEENYEGFHNISVLPEVFRPVVTHVTFLA